MANICEVQLSDVTWGTWTGLAADTAHAVVMEHTIYNAQTKTIKGKHNPRGEKCIHKSFDSESRQKSSHHFTYLANFRTKPRCC